MIEKEQLRAGMRERLADLATGPRRGNSAGVWERLAGLPEFQVAKCLCAYVAVGAEIETEGLIRQLLAIGRDVCLPAWREGYVPVRIADFDRDLVAGKFGIPEPVGAEVCRQPEVWLVPGLAFDRAGNRLGRGRGFYDALLRGARGVKIGLAHDFQLVNHVPAGAGDVSVDYVVTNHETVACRRNHGTATMGN